MAVFEMHLGIDPGSKTTGLALMQESNDGQRHVLCLFDLIHRGFQIKKALEQRHGFRCRRRPKNLRYRAPRFNNRTKPKNGWERPTLTITATGRGRYQRNRLTQHGFPRGYLMRQKQVHGFQTDEMVKAVVPTGKKAGTHTGRVAVRKTGSFNIQTQHSAVQDISYKYCTLIQRGDSYGYHLMPTIYQSTKGGTG